MVYLTCAVIGLGGRGVIKTWTEVAARVRLYMLTSDLTSLVPPQFSHLAASEESWHRYFIYFYLFTSPEHSNWWFVLTQSNFFLVFKNNFTATF